MWKNQSSYASLWCALCTRSVGTRAATNVYFKNKIKCYVCARNIRGVSPIYMLKMWDVAEVSFGRFTTKRNRNNTHINTVPIYSAHQQSAYYVNYHMWMHSNEPIYICNCQSGYFGGAVAVCTIHKTNIHRTHWWYGRFANIVSIIKWFLISLSHEYRYFKLPSSRKCKHIIFVCVSYVCVCWNAMQIVYKCNGKHCIVNILYL